MPPLPTRLLVQANGKAAVNFEHAWGDGVAVLRYFNEVFDASTALRTSGGSGGSASSGAFAPPRRLSFDVPASVKAAVRDAKSRFDATIGSTELAVLESVEIVGRLHTWLSERRSSGGHAGSIHGHRYRGGRLHTHTHTHGPHVWLVAIRLPLGAYTPPLPNVQWQVLESDVFTAPLLKKHRASPDGMLQMSFQLAHNRMHGFSAATYESASTAAFKHGRTETIRSATPESHAFAAAFCDGRAGGAKKGAKATPSEKVALMRKAAANHSRITRDALTGNGMDRHLFALRKLAEEGGSGAGGDAPPPLPSHTIPHLLSSHLSSPLSSHTSPSLLAPQCTRSSAARRAPNWARSSSRRRRSRRTRSTTAASAPSTTSATRSATASATRAAARRSCRTAATRRASSTASRRR